MWYGGRLLNHPPYPMRSLTKLSKPGLTAGLVQRPSALKRLDATVNTGLAVICAPAGYGKTTLVCQWLRQTRMGHGWLSLDERDNDEVRFWRNVCGALAGGIDRVAESSLLDAPQAHRGETQSQIDSLVYELTEYSRTWSAQDPHILVLDDFHEIKNPKIHKQLSYFIDDCPSFLKVVITTRIEPHLHLSDRRVKNSLTELTVRELAFDFEAFEAFIQPQLSSDLGEPALRALFTKTEGWPAAMQLAALAIKHHSDPEAFIDAFTGNQQLLSAYLFEEVFSHLSPEMQAVLIKLSVMSTFCAELIEAAMEDCNGYSIISELKRQNLFIIALDEHQCWFRLHDLFRDWLLQQLASTKSVDMQEIRRKAGAWLESQGLYLDALEHIFACKDWPWASQVSGGMMVDLIGLNQVGVAALIVEYFPEDFLTTQPALCFLKAMSLAGAQPERAIEWLTCAQKHLLTLPEPCTPASLTALGLSEARSVNELLAGVLSLQGYLAGIHGDDDMARDRHQQVLSIPGVERFPLYTSVLSLQALDLYCQNRFSEAEQYLLASIQQAKANNAPLFLLKSLNLLCAGYYYLGKHHLSEGMIAEAEAWMSPEMRKQTHLQVLLNFSKAMFLLSDNQPEAVLDVLATHQAYGKCLPPEDQMIDLFLQAAALNCLHRFDEALLSIDEMAMVFQRHFTRWVFPQPDVDAFRAITHLWAGNEEAFFQWAHDYETMPFHGNALARVERWGIYLLSRVLQREDVREEAKALRRLAEESHCVVWQIRGWMLDVAHYGLRGKKIRAMHAFAKALKLGAMHNIVGVFLEGGANNIPLLEGAIKLRLDVKFATKVLSTLKASAYPGMPLGPANPEAQDLVPLSGRELELLKLIHAGYSNRQIAEVTQITEGTVKAHLSNVYSKLAVKNRTQAVAVARAQGILG